MNGTVICQAIFETVRKLVHNCMFLNAYSIGNAFTRLRKLTFLNVFFYLLHLSKKSMAIKMADFMDDFSSVGFPNVSKQALSKARQGISPEAFAELHRISVQTFYEKCDDLHTWNGYLVLAIDGTSFQLPQTQRNMETFGASVNQNSSPCAMASSSSLFDVLHDIIIDARIDSYNYGERKFAREHLDELECIGLKNDKLILMDRGYPSYEMFQELLRRKLAFVVRLNSTFSSITQRAGEDFIMDYKPRGYKEPVKLRIVRIVLDDGTVETLATNLYEAEITLEMFRTLYFLRWGVESKYYEFKERIQLEEFSGSHPTAIRQDFYISVFLSNLVSILKSDVDSEIAEQDKDTQNKYRYQANRSFLINRMNKYVIKILTGAVKAEETIQRIISSAVKVRSQKQPDRKYSRKKKQSRRKHHNNRKPCL